MNKSVTQALALVILVALAQAAAGQSAVAKRFEPTEPAVGARRRAGRAGASVAVQFLERSVSAN